MAKSAADGRSIGVIMAAGAVVLAISFGARSVFGGVLDPISRELFDDKIEVFALSLAIQNLVWGLAQPFFGMIADRYGDRRALWLGFVAYIAGMVICIYGASAWAQHLGAGVLIGMGVSGTAFGLVLAVVGRAAPEAKRGQYLAITAALGSTGQVLMPLLAAELTAAYDWRTMLWVITALLLPMALCIPFLKARPAPTASPADRSDAVEPMGRVIGRAFGAPSYGLLNLGFFVCGFHVAFITAHFPTFVEHFCQAPGMTPDELRGLGLQAIAIVGVANIIGTLMAGQLGAKFGRPYVLSAIYALRAVVILIFISLPITPVSVVAFSFAMGILWLSTVPLTSAIVATMFGPRHMGTLYGFVFLSHQLGGFLGVWLGGRLFDLHQNYDMVWWLAIGLGVFSALVHLPVQDRAYRTAAA